MKLKLIPILRSAFDVAYIAIMFVTSMLVLVMAVSMNENPTPEFSTSVSYMSLIIEISFIGKIAFHFYDSYKGAN